MRWRELAVELAREYPVPTDEVLRLLDKHRGDERCVRFELDCQVRGLPCPLPTDSGERK